MVNKYRLLIKKSQLAWKLSVYQLNYTCINSNQNTHTSANGDRFHELSKQVAGIFDNGETMGAWNSCTLIDGCQIMPINSKLVQINLYIRSNWLKNKHKKNIQINHYFNF